jgi:hypothetical protein
MYGPVWHLFISHLPLASHSDIIPATCVGLKNVGQVHLAAVPSKGLPHSGPTHWPFTGFSCGGNMRFLCTAQSGIFS